MSRPSLQSVELDASKNNIPWNRVHVAKRVPPPTKLKMDFLSWNQCIPHSETIDPSSYMTPPSHSLKERCGVTLGPVSFSLFANVANEKTESTQTTEKDDGGHPDQDPLCTLHL